MRQEEENKVQLVGDGQVQSSAMLTLVRRDLSQNKWAVMLVVAIGVIMATLDSSIVNISLPAVAHYFSVPLSGEVEWVVIAYLVSTAAILLTAGRLADMIGRRVIWLSGLIIFTVSSALCGLAPTLGFLIAARAVQGLGGALLMAVSQAMLTSAFPAGERGRALGLNAVYVALGVSIGPTLGGFITTSFSWRWIFYVNVPIGIIGVIAALIILREKTNRNPGRFDPLGALLLAFGLASITAALSFGVELGWGSLLIVVLLLVFLFSFILLPFVEARVENPVIVFSLLKNRVFTSSILSLILSFLALFAVSFLMPFYYEELRGYSPQMAGLLLTPLPIAIALLAPFTGALADRIGTRWLAASGMALACVGLVSLSFLDAHSSIFDQIWRMLLIGIGQSLFQSPNNSALMGSAPPGQQGSASGFLATGRTIGQCLSIALSGAIFTGFGSAQAGLTLSSGLVTPELQQTFVVGFRSAFIVCAAIAAIGIFASLIRGKDIKKISSVQPVAVPE